jgi:uncharacterized membrane protein
LHCPQIEAVRSGVVVHLFQWLQYNSWIVALTSSSKVDATLYILHYVGLFLAVGSVAFVDLRVLGIAGRSQDASAVAAQLFPWMWTGLGLTFLSGFVMFAGSATQYLPNTLFYAKMALLVLAVLCGVLVERRAPRWKGASPAPGGARVLALISLLLWLGALLVALEIPAVTGVG